MRPDQLSPLFASARSLSGIGPRMLLLLKKAVTLPPSVEEPRVLDLIWHMPSGVIDRRAEPSVKDAVAGTIATLKVRVLKHNGAPRANRKVPHRVICEDDSGKITLVFFHTDRSFLERQLPVGEERYVSGRVDAYGDGLQMTHPDYIVAPDARDTLPMLEPVYPLTAGLSGKVLLKATRQAVKLLVDLREWQDESWRAKQGWPSFKEAVERVHAPSDPADVSAGDDARQRLAYDELFAGQIALAMVRERARARPGRAIEGTGVISRRILDALPFSLTGSQTGALKEITDDMGSGSRMLRLLQGDVGSGKTVVALLAMARAVEFGAQCALMAPTEVLARQHMETIGPLAGDAGLKVSLLTGREKGRTRQAVIDELANGDIDILIGTHALFQPDVVFKDLAFAVIDEQHRFGVHQRLALQSKGGSGGANVLVMTATPIPRTLLMTHYGDLDVSRLLGKPAGRKPVITTKTSTKRIADVIEGLGRSLKQGAQVYWVCPLIESSQVVDLAAASERHAHLAQNFGADVGLLHGGMSSREKDRVMGEFASGKLKILVATTVIEVGVNVPNATIMVLEHAERFGLAQLHQLRGRVGRGERQSYCILLYKPPLGEVALARLDMMRETQDGFLIAEKDLELRGGGEVLGARQSGLPEFRVADVPGFAKLLGAARDDARLFLDRDPELTSERGKAVRSLLYLFECDEAVRLFRAA